MRKYLDRIVINPKIMLGKPVIKGTRIPIYVLLSLLAEGYSIEKILEEYPTLKSDDVKAAIQFGAKLSEFKEPSFYG